MKRFEDELRECINEERLKHDENLKSEHRYQENKMVCVLTLYSKCQ